MFFKVWLPLIVVVSFVASFVFAVVYQRVRRPGWADTAANVEIPWACWLIAAIIGAAIVWLAILISRDPLQPHH